MQKIKVLAAGTFDLLHKGHIKFLSDAAALGDELHVIVARDSSVKRIKNFFPTDSIEERYQKISAEKSVFKAYKGEEKNFLALPQKISPDIIALGYDQEPPKGLAENFPETTIVRINPYKPDQYKSG